MKRAVARVIAPHRSDEGSALILALIILVAVGIVLSTALTFAGTGVGNGPKIRDLRNQTYYGQGAVDGAINNIRGSSINGTFINGSSGPCPTFTPASVTSGQNLGADSPNEFRVRCQGIDSGSEPGDKAPIFAIQTLGPVGGSIAGTPNGINQSLGTNNTLTIDGGIFSNGRVWNKGSGGVDMSVEGTVLATGQCIGTIHTTDPAGLKCNQVQTLGADPQYPPAVNSSSALSSLITTSGADPLPTCPSVNSHIAWFSPGYYSEQPDTLLTEASNVAGSNCSGNEPVYWFQPGFYYFDFTNATAGSDWNVNKVVGGTPLASGPAWKFNGDLLPTDGTACDSRTNPDSTPTQPGVQFIFGGNSRFNVGHQDVAELCAPDHVVQSPGSAQSISLYGLNGNSNQGTFAPTTTTDSVQSATVPPDAQPPSGFLVPASAQTIDGASSTAAMLNNSTAALAYSHFQNIPPGSSNVTAKIRLARTITVGNLDKETLSIKFPGKPTATNIDVPGSCGNSSSPCDIAIPNNAWPANAADWRQFNGASLTYTAKTKNSGATVNVDGIALLATYMSPALEPLNIGDRYFTDAHDPQTSIFMHGTVYAPSVGLDVEGQNVGRVIFSRGVILKSLLVDSNPSFTQTQAPFQTPGVKGSRLVLFTGETRPNSSGAWTPIVQACVKYNDNNSSGSPGPDLPGYTLSVKHWTVLRSGTGAGPPCT